HRRLARAFGAADAAQLAGVDGEAELVERAKAVKAHRDVLQVEDHLVRQVELAPHQHVAGGGLAVPVFALVFALGVEARGLAVDLEGGDHAFAPLPMGVPEEDGAAMRTPDEASALMVGGDAEGPAPDAAEAASSAGAVRGARSLHHSPITPCGRNSVTAMNRKPRKKGQYSGMVTVKKLFARLTMPAPSTAPTSVPRPPTATHTAISIELAGLISDGLMMPTCGTYSAPANPHSIADTVQMNSS